MASVENVPEIVAKIYQKKTKRQSIFLRAFAHKVFEGDPARKKNAFLFAGARFF